MWGRLSRPLIALPSGVRLAQLALPGQISTARVSLNQEDDRRVGKRVKIKKRTEATFPKIYTRTGDGGNSSLFTGERRPKSDLAFEALGCNDELSSNVGFARELAEESSSATLPFVNELLRIQCILQDIGSCIATPTSSARQMHKDIIPKISSSDTRELEQWIDAYSQGLPKLDQFILPGGGKVAASLHVARAVCRRTERLVVALVKSGEVEPEALKYLNRLSDYLFTIARLATRLEGHTEDCYTRSSPEVKEGGCTKMDNNIESDAWKKNKPE